MTPNSTVSLEKLAASSLEQCLLRLSRVSAGTWKVLDIKVYPGNLEDAVKQRVSSTPAAAVYFNLNAGSAITTLMVFNPADVQCISKCFTGLSFPRGAHTTPAEEVMLLELGNIVLNALANSVLNAMKKSAMPAVPQYAEGDAARLLAGLGTMADLTKYFLVIKASLAIKCDLGETISEVFVLLPPELAAEWKH